MGGQFVEEYPVHWQNCFEGRILQQWKQNKAIGHYKGGYGYSYGV